MNYSFPKSLRLRTRRDYQRMAQGSYRLVGAWVIAEIRSKKDQNSPRLGITVTRRFGKSHYRNRFKRLVREAFRLSHSSYLTGVDILIRPRTAAIQATFQDIQKDFDLLMQKAKFI